MRMKNSGKFFLLLIFLVAGILFGGLIGELARNVDFLSWLSYSKSLGISPDAPLVLNFAVLRLTFGFMIELNIAMVLGILASLFLYKKFV